MLIFIDFETDGFDGDITEACAVDVDLNVINFYSKESKIPFEDFIKEILIDEDTVIVFWHHFMPVYLATKHIEIYTLLQGRFILFTDIYSFFDGVKKTRYKIADITKELTGREHQGNACSDAIDLAMCFKVLQNKLI